MKQFVIAALLICPWQFIRAESADSPLPAVAISEDRTGFTLSPGGTRFIPWGFNYDHDADGRLIEDYWHQDWISVERHFEEMKELGANVVRIHLQFGRFMESPERGHQQSLQQLARLVKLAEKTRLYLDLTGLACYHKQDVPPWYDDLNEAERWAAQAHFWKEIATVCRHSPAIFCYDLMNEPVVPGGRRENKDWLGPPFGGKHFVQFITLDQAGRPRPDIAKAWIQHLVAAIRKVDDRHLITVGLVDWSLDRPGLTSGFVPQKVAGDLDFLAVHIYPERGKTEDALKTLHGFQIGKPVIIEETFPLKCSQEELMDFIEKSKPAATGWIGFYWGTPPGELKKSSTLKDALILRSLEAFQEHNPNAAESQSQPSS